MKTTIWDEAVQGIIKNNFRYDPESGILYRIKATVGRFGKCGPVGGLRKTGYLQVFISHERKVIGLLVHRVAYFLHTGEQPPEVDHIDGNRANNAALNLRSSSRSKNLFNKIKKFGPVHKGLPHGITITQSRRVDYYKAQIIKDGVKYERVSRRLDVVVEWRRKKEIEMYGFHPAASDY